MTILWDWNGTLLDDTAACIDALNIMLARRGIDPIATEFYRREFSFPVKAFYKKIGVRLEDEDWDALAQEYHDVYHTLPYGLNTESLAALGLAKSSGARQAIISAMKQDVLDADTAPFGVAEYMEAVYGTSDLYGGTKTDRARELTRMLGKDDYVLIGDSLHDWEVARAVGAEAVLFSGGGHSAARLEAVAPTFGSLVECVRFALGKRN